MLVALLGCSGSTEDERLVAGGGGEAGSSGGSAGSAAGGSSGAPSMGGTSSGGTFPIPEGGSGGGAPQYEEQNLIEMRIEPVDLELPAGESTHVLGVRLGESKQLSFKAFGRFAAAPDDEVELTERTVFYVPDNYLVASFPEDGSNVLSTRLPADADDAQQRGGKLTVQAQAANTDGSVTTATLPLVVTLTGAPTLEMPDDVDAVPEDADVFFEGAAAPERAPVLAYPNDGVLLPPNLGQLEVHFQRGAPENTLFQVQFESAASTLTYYTRCFSDSDLFEAGACAITVSGADYENLAASNQGTGPVKLTVRGSDEAGTFGESASFDIEFAAQRIDGAVYYWTTSNETSIMRFDFGSGQSLPETFVAKDSAGNDGSDIDGYDTNGECVGCHALSRQGDKMFYSLGNSQDGALMYINDLSRETDDAEFYAYNGSGNVNKPAGQQYNRVLTGSFSPDGSEFVAVAPVNDGLDDETLVFHDGDTGVRGLELALPFIPSSPDWSPDGNSIAVTRVGTNLQTISFLGGGISLIQKVDGEWDGENPVTIVPDEDGKNRFNPTFTPDGALLLYTEVDEAGYPSDGSYAGACSSGDPNANPGKFCNGYSDPGARTWAVLPTASASPVLLTKAAMPGVGDVLYPPVQTGVGPNALMDTYPKAAPFVISHRGKNIGWFTVGSQRRAGLRKQHLQASVVGDPKTQSLLWMFALDSSKVMMGGDGSYPGFFLPFQDLETSNHMAQWTERIVSAEPPPPAPVPPPPAPPPAPPPPPVILR